MLVDFATTSLTNRKNACHIAFLILGAFMTVKAMKGKIHLPKSRFVQQLGLFLLISVPFVVMFTLKPLSWLKSSSSSILGWSSGSPFTCK